MMKSTIAFAAIAFAFALAPVQAQTTTCTSAELTKLEAENAKMTDATKKAAAMKEVTMAKDMMAKKDDKGCVMHMENAMKMIPKS